MNALKNGFVRENAGGGLICQMRNFATGADPEYSQKGTEGTSDEAEKKKQNKKPNSLWE